MKLRPRHPLSSAGNAVLQERPRQPTGRWHTVWAGLALALVLATWGVWASEAVPAKPKASARPATGELARAAGPVVDHRTIDDFLAVPPEAIAAAARLRMLFIDHSVGQNIHEALDCTASASLEEAPSRCKRFEHVVPRFSADPSRFRFGRQYDRSRWVYHYGASSYWRDWPGEIAALLGDGKDWDVVIPMPSYLVAPNGGWEPLDELEQRYPQITFVYATSSLPRGADGGTERDLVMQAFNTQAREYALRQGKPLLDVADLLSHDYEGRPCYDNRDGVEYCQAPGRCENLPDDGLDIPAICPHYTTELYGGHLGNVSGGALRMSQAVWLLMAQLAAPPSPEPSPPGPSPATTASPSPTAAEPTPSPSLAPPETRTVVPSASPTASPDTRRTSDPTALASVLLPLVQR